jgi:hypothetical protein
MSALSADVRRIQVERRVTNGRRGHWLGAPAEGRVRTVDARYFRACYVCSAVRRFVAGFVFEAAGPEFAAGMRFGTPHGAPASVRTLREGTGSRHARSALASLAAPRSRPRPRGSTRPAGRSARNRRVCAPRAESRTLTCRPSVDVLRPAVRRGRSGLASAQLRHRSRGQIHEFGRPHLVTLPQWLTPNEEKGSK